MSAITDLVANARGILAQAPNLKRVKLAFTLDRDGSLSIENIAFTGVVSGQ